MPILPVSVARENLSSVLDQCKSEPVFLEKHGKQVAVVVSIDSFTELQEFHSSNRDTAKAYEILLEKYLKLQANSFVQK
jgi:prevent-host-death family protein